MRKRVFRSVAITGASRGIGAAVALRYARAGASLALLSRNAADLEAVASQCRAAGAEAVRVTSVDVRDHAALSGALIAFDSRRPIDLLVANAGVTGGWSNAGAPERPENSRELLEINLMGALNAVHAVLPRMRERRSGQIAVMSSIAAFVPLPGLPSYCASKAALLAYALALRETVRADGIGVSAICPGYVDTVLLSRLSGARPTLITPAAAAAAIFAGLARDRRIIAFPFFIAALTRLIALLPESGVRLLLPAQTVAPIEEA